MVCLHQFYCFGTGVGGCFDYEGAGRVGYLTFALCCEAVHNVALEVVDYHIGFLVAPDVEDVAA